MQAKNFKQFKYFNYRYNISFLNSFCVFTMAFLFVKSNGRFVIFQSDIFLLIFVDKVIRLRETFDLLCTFC